jgi:pyruvate dehydrogenase E2 component (dihydrolipoamide acetyltransferase)
MAKILEMPKLSPTMEEGVLTAWHKKEGDDIQVDDLLAEVETDKATMEFRAFDKGSLLKLLVKEGAEVKLGQPVAIVGNPGEDVAALLSDLGAPSVPPPAPAPAKPKAEPEPTPEARPVQMTEAPVAQRAPAPREKGSLLDRTERDGRDGTEVPSPAARGGRVMASPYVRRAALERGIDLQGASGSGPGGRVVARDLDALAEGAPPTREEHGAQIVRIASGAQTLRPHEGEEIRARAAGGGLAEPEVRPLSMMRKTIARRLTESKKNVPHFYLTIDVDADALSAFREKVNQELEPKSNGKSNPDEKPLRISVNDLLVKACAVALTRVPECNAQFTPDAILIHQRVDISVAVAVPDGLLTPVVRNADQKSVVAIAREVRELAARARAKKLRPEEMQDGTFSISNLGMFGIDAFAAVINPPEGAILAVGQVREEPVVKDGQVTVGKKLAMTLSCDHRVVDGAVGAAFLAELRSLLEHPMRIVTG